MSSARTVMQGPVSPTRRSLLSAIAFAAAAASLPKAALSNAAPMVAKKLPRTDATVPAIGLGTFLTWDVLPGEPREHLREVLRRFFEGGGRAVDTSPLYGTGEINVGDFATSLGINQRLFVTNKIWSTGEYLADESHARRSLEASLRRLWRGQIDVMQCHSLVNVDVIVPILQAWKKEGRILYVGVTHHENGYTPLLVDWVERDVVDFVQVNYSIYSRGAEQRLLAAAQERGVGVLVNMPFEKARLFKVVEGRPLPPFAAELGIENWAQYFLKWVIAHPAVTCALPSTSNPEHQSQNIAALRGPLPDAGMRERMARQMQTIPGFERIGQMAWYPDKRYAGLIARAQAQTRSRLQ
jgi:diketogulonate reductase-like aldo/keto reductase